MRPGIAAALAVMLLSPNLAVAQASLSADDILQALKPRQGAIGPTRGLRGAGPIIRSGEAGPAATPRATTVVPGNNPSIDLTVPFTFDSAELLPAATRVLDELGKALTHPTLASAHFRIEGHTDTVGSRSYNKALSERRADSVVEYLFQRFGVRPTRLQALGVGEDGLLVATPEQTPEPRNRRVHIVNLDG